MLIPPSWLTAWKLLPFSVSSMFQKALRELGPRALTYLLLPTESKPCVNYGSTEGNLSVGAEQAMAELETDLKGGIVHSDRFFFLSPPAAGLVPAFHLRLTFTQQLLAQCENCSEVLNHSSFVLQLFSRTFYVSCGLYTCKLGACQGSLTDVLLCLFSNIWRGKWQEMQILTFPYFKRQAPPPHFQSQPVAQADTCFIPSFVRQSWECRFPPKEFLFQWLSFSYYYVY